MIALARMRLAGFLRTGRSAAPVIASLVVLAAVYGGGQAQPGEAYGVSAVILFPVLAWQTKLLLDIEPDVQRRLALVVVGSRLREQGAGLIAAAVAGLGTIAAALAVPWLVAGVTGPQAPDDPPVAVGIGLGVWAHLLALAAAVALGALASRASTGSIAFGVMVLATGTVGALVLGQSETVVAWLAPPLIATARATSGAPEASTLAVLTGHAALWSIAMLGVYSRRRGRRA